MADARWTFGIGDPTFIGWLTVVSYAVAAALSLRAAFTARASETHFGPIDPLEARDQRAMKHVWVVIAATLVVLGINKQLDLQTLLIQKVRRQAYIHGWYGDRRRYQEDFIAVVLVLGLVAVIGLSIRLRRVLRRLMLAITGMAMLVVFVAIRAASFHYVDKALSLGGRFRLSWILELSGIGLVSFSALHWLFLERRHLLSSPTPPGPSSNSGVPTTSVV